MLCVGIPSAIATGYWLKVVFARYQTTLALPIEYSMLNICAVGGGLIFYNEAVYMNEWQLPLVLAGCCVMTLGGFMIVAVGLRLEELRILPDASRQHADDIANIAGLSGIHSRTPSV
jgi:hypothetical protein